MDLTLRVLITGARCGLVAALLAASLRAATPSDPHEQLKAAGVLSDTDALQLEAGETVAKVLDSPDRAEVVSFAATRVRASASRFLECTRDVSCLRANEDVLEVGRFGPVPRPSDLAGLSLDARDREHLSRCEIGRCDVRLPESAIERFRTGIDWSSPGNPTSAAELFRITLAGFASAYLAEGNRALAIYHDNPHPAAVGASINELLQRQWFALDGCPELVAYLRDFPEAHLASAEEFVYWYKEKFWRKTLVSLNHVIVYPKNEGTTSRVYVASKQLYATHYLESSIEALVFEGDPGGGSGTLVFLSRTRADTRPAGFNWLERVIIRRLVRGRLENQFRQLRRRLETSDTTNDLEAGEPAACADRASRDGTSVTSRSNLWASWASS